MKESFDICFFPKGSCNHYQALKIKRNSFPLTKWRPKIEEVKGENAFITMSKKLRRARNEVKISEG